MIVIWNHVIFSYDVFSQNSSTDESGDKCWEVKHGATWECVRPEIFHDLSEFPASTWEGFAIQNRGNFVLYTPMTFASRMRGK